MQPAWRTNDLLSLVHTLFPKSVRTQGLILLIHSLASHDNISNKLTNVNPARIDRAVGGEKELCSHKPCHPPLGQTS